MRDVLTWTERIVTQDCVNCGMRFGVPESFDKMRLEDGRSFYCPAGHSQSYTRRRDELEAARARASALQDQLRATEKSLAAQKGQNTKLKNRVGKGVCPCCNRHFANVERHMASKHPDYSEGGSA